MQYFMDRMFDFEAVKYKRFTKAANEDGCKMSRYGLNVKAIMLIRHIYLIWDFRRMIPLFNCCYGK